MKNILKKNFLVCKEKRNIIIKFFKIIKLFLILFLIKNFYNANTYNKKIKNLYKKKFINNLWPKKNINKLNLFKIKILKKYKIILNKHILKNKIKYFTNNKSFELVYYIKNKNKIYDKKF